jgi:hypothetical protein
MVFGSKLRHSSGFWLGTAAWNFRIYASRLVAHVSYLGDGDRLIERCQRAARAAEAMFALGISQATGASDSFAGEPLLLQRIT